MSAAQEIILIVLAMVLAAVYAAVTVAIFTTGVSWPVGALWGVVTTVVAVRWRWG